MSVVTKTGDDGKSRFLGKIVDKDSDLLEAVGALDELQAALGLINSKIKTIQDELYEIMGNIAYETRNLKLENRIKRFEVEIKEAEKELKPLSKFLIFRNNKAAKINWVRTVCRRAERALVKLSRSQQIDSNILIYINRLSDYLFIKARQEEK